MSEEQAKKFHSDDMSLDQVDPVHQYVISVLVPETSFWGETGGVVAKCWLFSEANALPQGFNTNQKYRKIQHDGVSQRFAGYRKKQKKKQQHIQPAIHISLISVGTTVIYGHGRWLP